MKLAKWFYSDDSSIFLMSAVKVCLNKRLSDMLLDHHMLECRYKFKYLNIVDSYCDWNADIKSGFYDKLKFQLQGQRNTYYAGGLMAFELTERNSSYAMALVCKHFSNNSTPPGFLYVKVCNTTIVNK